MGKNINVLLSYLQMLCIENQFQCLDKSCGSKCLEKYCFLFCLKRSFRMRLSAHFSVRHPVSSVLLPCVNIILRTIRCILMMWHHIW